MWPVLRCVISGFFLTTNLHCTVHYERWNILSNVTCNFFSGTITLSELTNVCCYLCLLWAGISGDAVLHETLVGTHALASHVTDLTQQQYTQHYHCIIRGV